MKIGKKHVEPFRVHLRIHQQHFPSIWIWLSLRLWRKQNLSRETRWSSWECPTELDRPVATFGYLRRTSWDHDWGKKIAERQENIEGVIKSLQLTQDFRLLFFLPRDSGGSVAIRDKYIRIIRLHISVDAACLLLPSHLYLFSVLNRCLAWI